MNTFQVETAHQAQFLNKLQQVSETVIAEARATSLKVQQLADQVSEGQGAIIDFSTSHSDRYREALAQREALLQLAHGFGFEPEALMAAASGQDVWFTATTKKSA